MRGDFLKHKWDKILKLHKDDIELAMLRGLHSCQQIGVAFITIKKDRYGGFLFNNKLWHEIPVSEKRYIEDELKHLGAIGPFGGDPKDHKGE